MNTPPPPEDNYAFQESGQRRPEDYLRWFIRRFWVFLITLLGGLILGLYTYSLTPEVYESTSTIEILRVKQEDGEVDEKEKVRMTGLGEMLSLSEKLKLPRLYAKIAEGPHFSNREKVAPEKFPLPWEEPANFSSSEISPEALGGMIRGWVSVRWRPDTALLDISARHSDPAIAQDTLTGLLAAYEESTESRVAGSSEFALDYILESSTEIKKRILTLDKALGLYNRCTELSDEIRSAERQITEMEKRYLPKWPALVEASQLHSILKDRFAQELQRVINLSEEEQLFWEENREMLAALNERVESEIQLVGTRSNVLDRELEAEQQIYDSLITKLKEGNLSKGFAGKQFDVVQPPNFPSYPTGPDKKKILIKYTAGGAALGIGIILFLGFLDPSLRTVSELELLTGLPVIGALPAIKESERPNSIVFIDDAETPVIEAMRTLRAGLTFLGTSKERCSFLVTSAVPGEGKSFVASNLALAFALQGDRTLLIDADLRHPVQSHIFGYERRHPGLSDHLSLGTSLNSLLKRTKLSENLFLLGAGSHSANPSELLAGVVLPEMITLLTNHFDRIIIDSAPLVPVSDTIPLARTAQSVVLVTRMGKTPKGAIKRALRILQMNHSEPIGIVANGLPKTRMQGSYGYYYSYSGGGDYSGYASDTLDDSETGIQEPILQANPKTTRKAQG